VKNAIKQVSRLLAFLVFVTIFIVGYPFDLPFSIDTLWPIIFKATIGAALFKIGGLIIADIIIKGVVEDIDSSELEPLLGGLEQRIHDIKQKQHVTIVERQLNLAAQKQNSK
jgi:hypothetical protein